MEEVTPRYGTPLTALKKEGLSNRAYNALMRSGYTTVEDLVGTDPDEMVIAQGPEPPTHETIIRHPNGPRHSSIMRYEQHLRHSDAWEFYRYRPAWSDLYNLGVGTVLNIEDALAQWKARCRQLKGSYIIEVEESESSATTS